MGPDDTSPAAGDSPLGPAASPFGDVGAESPVARHLEDCKRRVNELAAERLRELADLGERLRDWVEETNRQLDRLGGELGSVPLTGVDPRSGDVTVGNETSAADAAHLVAMQMAVRGATRDEVDRYLRDVFEIEHTSAILERAFAD